jgi:hypothetical protein
MTPYITQVAKSIPFDNSTNGYTAIDLQTAVEESRATAIGNDRYTLFANFNGNAITGRFLEIFPGFGSDIAPFIFPKNCKIVDTAAGCFSNSTGTISFYRSTDLVNPIFSMSFSNEKRKTAFNTNHVITALDELVIKVSSGSLNKPFLVVWAQSTL